MLLKSRSDGRDRLLRAIPSNGPASLFVIIGLAHPCDLHQTRETSLYKYTNSAIRIICSVAAYNAMILFSPFTNIVLGGGRSLFGIVRWASAWSSAHHTKGRWIWWSSSSLPPHIYRDTHTLPSQGYDGCVCVCVYVCGWSPRWKQNVVIRFVRNHSTLKRTTTAHHKHAYI